jgi:hypothetical protein
MSPIWQTKVCGASWFLLEAPWSFTQVSKPSLNHQILQKGCCFWVSRKPCSPGVNWKKYLCLLPWSRKQLRGAPWCIERHLLLAASSGRCPGAPSRSPRPHPHSPQLALSLSRETQTRPNPSPTAVIYLRRSGHPQARPTCPEALPSHHESPGRRNWCRSSPIDGNEPVRLKSSHRQPMSISLLRPSPSSPSPP